MTRKEYEWEVNLVKERQHALNLTFEQAEQVYKYEQEKQIYSEEYFFSQWEEWDYEFTTFREILDNEQLKTYLGYVEEQKNRYEQELVEMDSKRVHEIGYHEELINFYETRFLPDFFKNPYLLRFHFIPAHKAKVDYLKSEYKRFLSESKKAILTNHFRYSRIFQPNELKVSLLRHQLGNIFPDYFSFKHRMDEPTKAIASFLSRKVAYLPTETEELLKQKSAELRAFRETLTSKYYGKQEGWHIVIGQRTPEEEKECDAMTLVLLEKDN